VLVVQTETGTGLLCAIELFRDVVLGDYHGLFELFRDAVLVKSWWLAIERFGDSSRHRE
jgi:hypothetical protein